MGATTLTRDAACSVIEVMGTVVSVDIRQVGLPLPKVADALDAVADWLQWVDQTFSTYRPDSEISRLGRAELTLADCDPRVAAVLQACAEAHATTDGNFVAVLGGRIDPTGLVKGWAAQEASQLLRNAGLSHHAIGAGGDVVCSGGPSPGQPWRIGIANPIDPTRLCTTVAVRDAAVATSGVAEKGHHVLDPHTGRPARGLLSATVVGADLTYADAYATAALAAGRSDAAWMERVDGYELLTIAEDGQLRWSEGFPAVLPATARRDRAADPRRPSPLGAAAAPGLRRAGC